VCVNVFSILFGCFSFFFFLIFFLFGVCICRCLVFIGLVVDFDCFEKVVRW